MKTDMHYTYRQIEEAKKSKEDNATLGDAVAFFAAMGTILALTAVLTVIM